MESLTRAAFTSTATLLLTLLGAAVAGDRVALTTQARLEIDAAGNVVDATPDAALDPATADAVRAVALRTRFAPPLRDGAPVGGTTHARFAICEAAQGGRAPRVVWTGHGPGFDGDWGPPPLPPSLTPGRETRGTIYRVQLHAGADGRVASTAVDVDARLRDARRREAEAAFHDWLKARRVVPERLAGAPVVTNLAWTIEYRVFTGGDIRTLASRAEKEMAEPWATGACAGDQAGPSALVALDSPFRVIDPG